MWSLIPPKASMGTETLGWNTSGKQDFHMASREPPPDYLLIAKGENVPL
jgi:hypothetical protein